MLLVLRRAILALALAATTRAEDIFPAELKEQKGYLHEVVSLCPYRDGVLAKTGSVHFAKFDTEVAKPFTIAGIEKVLGVERSGQGWTFLGYTGEKFMLAGESPGAGAKLIPLPEPLRNYNPVETASRVFPVLIPTSNPAALMTGTTLWLLDGETWKQHSLPKVPRFNPEFDPAVRFDSKRSALGQTCYVLGSTLFVGWDHGEWGGMLASIDLAAKGPRWVHLSDKKLGDPTGIPGDLPVQKIVSPDGKSLWVAMGLAHLSSMSSALSHRAANGEWSHLLSVNGKGDPQGPLALPINGCLTSIAADPQERLHLVAANAGIFRLEGKSLTRVLDYAPFGRCGDLAISKQGEFFLATWQNGILAFRQQEGKWQARQILLEVE